MKKNRDELTKAAVLATSDLACPCCHARLMIDAARLAAPGITLLKKEILTLWVAGWAQKEIAASMGRSRWCVHSHIDQACRLLGVPVDQRKVTLWLYELEGKD